MKQNRGIVLAALFMMLMGCGESDMTPDYIVKKPRILAIKITDPEIKRGDPFSLNLLVEGEGVSQEMATEVEWGVGVGYSETDADMLVLANLPYTETYMADATVWDALPSETLDALFQENAFIDVPVMAKIVVNGVTLRGVKTLRVTENPVGKNPVIQSVTVKYDGGSSTVTASDTRIITFKKSEKVPENIAISANMTELGEGENDKLIFRWTVSASKTSDGELYVNSSNADIEALLGENAKAAEYRDTVVFSTRGEEGDDPVQYGEYEVNLVVRDKKTDSAGREEDRFGVDFLTVTVLILDE